MKSPDLVSGIGHGVVASKFKSATRLRVVDNLDYLENVLGGIQLVHRLDLSGEARSFIPTAWEGSTPELVGLPSETHTVQGLDIAGENVFVATDHPIIKHSFLNGSNGVLLGAKSPYVESAILTGRTVMGGRSADTHAFSPHDLQVMIGVTEGLGNNNESQVMKGLERLEYEVISAQELHDYSSYLDERDISYASFGDFTEAAIVFDSYLAEGITKKETTMPQVTNSIIPARTSAFRQVLGGNISDSAVSADSVVYNAHMRFVNTYFLSNLGVEYIEKGRRGDPDRAEALVQALEELPDRPLAAYAA